MLSMRVHVLEVTLVGRLINGTNVLLRNVFKNSPVEELELELELIYFT